MLKFKMLVPSKICRYHIVAPITPVAQETVEHEGHSFICSSKITYIPFIAVYEKEKHLQILSQNLNI